MMQIKWKKKRSLCLPKGRGEMKAAEEELRN
jgi:hypothetical protein